MRQDRRCWYGVVCGLAVFCDCGTGSSGADPTQNANLDAAAGPTQGDERGSCYPNGTCNGDLVCLSDLCVRAPDSGGSSVDGGTLEDTGPTPCPGLVAITSFSQTST